MLKIKYFLLVFGMLLMPALMFGFTFTVTPTTETCSGNATLAFNVSNPNPNGSIEYIIYKLPNITVPYASTTNALLGGLTAGDYRVVAVETVGGATTTQQADVTITSAIVPLEFTVQSLNQACAAVSNISVNVTSGTAVSFEIFEGPITFPSQASNIFSNLTVGVYKIRVFDNCGAGVVSTFTVTLNPTGLSVGPPTFTNTSPPSCDFTIATQTITPTTGTVIAYPVVIQYTVHPPNGDPSIIINQTLASGNPLSQNIAVTLPTYLNQDYTYDLSITDACSSQTTNSFTSSQGITLLPNIYTLVCSDNYFELRTTNFTPPFTLDFTAFPAGFDPAVFNAQYPGPYSTSPVTFGSPTLITPLGSYTVTITDSCGKSKTITFDVLDVEPQPVAVATNNGCLSNSGKIEIIIPHYKIATAFITSAPASYPLPLPSDVSSFIDTASGVLTLPSVPLGDYIIELTDFCNNVIAPVSVSIPAYVGQPMVSDVRPGCELQKSSIRVSSGNSAKLTAVTVDAAPAGFGFPVPYLASEHITAAGEFYMNNLPSGNYTITGTDECGFVNTISVAVAGYAITSSAFSLQTNCGTFDLTLDFVSNANANETYWLQKQLDETANTWGHPVTEVPFTETSLPDATNSYPLSNNTTNYNLAFNGTFRIVRNFLTYNNGKDLNTGIVTAIDKNCTEILQPTLEFNESLDIIDAYRMPCSADSSLDVIVDVNGTPPLHYTITEKDGVPFDLDNGTSNVFSNLEAGVYTFQVQDNCGNIVNRIFDVGALASLINLTKPDDLVSCAATVTGNETFDLSQQSSIILGPQSPSEYTLQYFASEADAQSGTNPISNLTAYNPPNNPQTIYARVYFNELSNCYELTTFDLFTGQTPQLNLNAIYLGCDVEEITVDATGNNLPTTTYSWSSGSSDASVTISTPGITNLTITATNAYSGNLACSVSKDIQVIISVPPTIDRIETVDWTDNQNTITVISTAPERYDYSLDNNNFQDQNIFTNLGTGLYDVYVRDKLGCGVIQQQVWLLNYPRFFTPNGDGYHDLWLIENSGNEPDFKVEIFDRYGKLLKVLYKDQGWDGRYNDREIFSDDYWFVVHRQDGKIFKGHFALKR
jgi:gliding motility-associated-like protein